MKTTGGGDWEECYELVLHQVQTQLNWSPGSQRALVMIGDAIPHDTTYPQVSISIVICQLRMAMEIHGISWTSMDVYMTSKCIFFVYQTLPSVTPKFGHAWPCPGLMDHFVWVGLKIVSFIV